MTDLSTASHERQKAERCGQGHLFAFWDELDAEQRHTLLNEIALANVEHIRAKFEQASDHKNDWETLSRRAEPPEAIRLNGHDNRFSTAQAQVAGERALRNGQVGAILVAGGQGTRLGFNSPKGMYEIGPVSRASLFQILLEKVLAVGRRYGAAIPLYVMTSDATHVETEDYFQAKNYFGLPPETVRLFCQGVMPAVDADTGKILLADKGRLALNPDGHGGMLAALNRTGGLADIQRRGIRHLFYFQVDNPLAPICDPVFLGHHLLAGSEISTLAVAKRDALERVGNIVRIDGRTQIIEYSDLPDEVARQTNDDGSLRFWAGNTAIHLFDVAFLNRAAHDECALPLHIARKKVPYINEQGVWVEPVEPNAIKFERFIFDLLPLAERAVVVEAEAAVAFAPVKNPFGAERDSPDTCQAAMMALHSQWLMQAGAKVAANVPVEISPMFALDAAQLRQKIKPGTKISEPTYFR
jgi:UDP-N-acetylglucosamine/UDP-N-acetylgalactosamine diphosphorylase